jgi:YidC/Oxa1 family membrane protein insertase
MPIGLIYRTVLETPLINVMVALSAVSFGSFGLAILVFTVLSRALLFPLTVRSLHSMRHMQDIQPRLQEIQKKYSDPRRRSEETMKLYKEAGINPIGCLGPQLIQFPVFIALYQVIRLTVATTPESVVNLSHRLYHYSLIQNAIPLSTKFLFFDLRANGGIFLTAIVFAAMWLQQRISTGRTPSTATQSGAQQQQMQTMMQWMMPALFSWFVFVSPAGLGVYWFASTAIGIILQWTFVGPGDFTWGSILPPALRATWGISLPEPGTRRGSRTRPQTDRAGDRGGTESGETNASSGDQRTNSRRGGRQGSGAARPSSRSSRRRRNHRG